MTSVWKSFKNPLFFVLLFGFVLRILGIGFGIGYHPDERHIAFVLESLKITDLNPHSFAYGGLYYYLQWLISWCFYPFSRGYENYIFYGRLFSVFSGTLTVYLVYRIGREISGKKAGLFSAFLLATSTLHLQNSTFATVDILLVFFMTAVLFFLVRYQFYALRTDLYAASVFFSAACSVKISAVSLGILFLGIFLEKLSRSRNHSKEDTKRVLKNFLISIVLFFVTNFIFQPYAWIDFTHYWADLSQQIGMVKGQWVPPYTMQYVDTNAYIYPLEQMVWGMGLLQSVLVAIGVLYTAVRIFKGKGSPAVILLFIWSFIFFAVVGRYQVKFPRYLLPIYPTLCLFGGIFLGNIYERSSNVKGAIKKTYFVALIGICALSPLSYIQVYLQPHIWDQASRWIYENIPSGSVILSEDWDDTLPVSLPGFSQTKFKVGEKDYKLAIYNTDSDEVVQTISRQLADADYIVLPTSRGAYALLQDTKRLPISTAYYRKLFAGQLGYDFLQSFRVSSRLGPLSVDDRVMDESISVYTHPRVVVFKNKKKMTSEQIYHEMTEATSSRVLSRGEVLSMDAGDQAAAEKMTNRQNGVSKMRQLFCVLLWTSFFFLIALFTYLLLSNILNLSAWITASLAIATAPFLFTYVAFLLSDFFGIDTTFSLLRGLLMAALFIASLWLLANGGPVFTAYRRERTSVHLTLVSVFIVFGFFLLQRLLHPEIFFGERPMDFSFINYFLRSESLPAEDPWFAGHSMSYYYFGSFMFAKIMKLLCIPPAVGYNLAIATVPALLAAAAMSLCGVLGLGIRGALFGVLLLFSGNLAFYTEWLNRDHLDFNLFWATSRILKNAMATEYSLWSALFGDLHAHVIMSPAVLSIVTLVAYWTKNLQFKNVYKVVGVASLLCGSLIAGNPWDVISMGVVLSIVLLCLISERPVHVKQIFSSVVIFLGVSTVLYLGQKHIFHRAGAMGQIGFEVHAFSSLLELFKMYGILFIGLIVLYCNLLFKNLNKVRAGHLVSGFLLSLVPLTTFASSYLFAEGAPCEVFLFCSFMMLMGWLTLRSESFPLEVIILGQGGFFLIAFSEVFYFVDRMNTLFKIHYVIWPLLSLHFAACLYYCLPLRKKHLLTAGFLTLLVSAGIVSGGICSYIMLGHRYIRGLDFTLDGTVYLESQYPSDHRIISWLNENIDKTKTILEAHGPSYQWFSRISTHTGLPAFVGWSHHVHQRGAPRSDIEERIKVVADIYQAQSADTAQSLAWDNGIGLIILGDLEKKVYKINQEVFLNHPEAFEVLFSFGDSYVLSVNQNLRLNQKNL